jgi:hypothetical protein
MLKTHENFRLFLTIVSLCPRVEGISREITIGQILANCVLRYRNVYLDALQQAIPQILLAKFHKADKDFG